MKHLSCFAPRFHRFREIAISAVAQGDAMAEITRRRKRLMILDRFKVTDRVAVITGAGRGIGRGIAIALAQAGADVVLAARRENTLQEVATIVENAGRRALIVPTDALVPEQLDRLVERALGELGGVDFLVNNVGGTLPGPALQCTDDELNKSFHFNVTTALHLSRMLAPS
ncbi:MAG: SDR family NAD(P)-dependent oxidoreductase, partial [Myxococcales bacterium]|nr:SDR family NAD(P)-dependent oxidoreductase [Myxococcales bacterium]